MKLLISSMPLFEPSPGRSAGRFSRTFRFRALRIPRTSFEK